MPRESRTVTSLKPKPKEIGVLRIPLLMCGINLLLQFGLRTDPKIVNASKTLVILAKWIIPVMTLFLMPITLFASMGVPIHIQVISTGFSRCSADHYG